MKQVKKEQRYQWRALPSHGRGHRFDPYSAHHFTGTSSAYLGTTRQNQARTGKLNVEETLNFVRRTFARFLARSNLWRFA